jgi:hypothetical protein
MTDRIETLLSEAGWPRRVSYVGHNPYEGEQFSIPCILGDGWAASISRATGAKVDIINYPAWNNCFVFLKF